MLPLRKVGFMTVYISEFNVWSAAGGDFVEIAASGGEDVSGYSIFVYHNDGTIASGPYKLGTAVGSQGDTDIYVVDAASDGLDLSYNSSIALVDDTGSVLQYISSSGNVNKAVEGPANGITSTDIGSGRTNESKQSNDEGATYFNQPKMNKGSIPCFAEGTLIETPNGPRRVETLGKGDLVCTTGSEPVEIQWSNTVTLATSDMTERTYPVRISAGALGLGRPKADLVVSQQHRIAVGQFGQLDAYFATPCLVPAKSLLMLQGIRLIQNAKGVTWHHFAFRKHALVSAAGAVSESCLLGPMVVERMPRFMRLSLEQGDALRYNGPPCLPCLTVHTAREQIQIAQTRPKYA